VRSDTIMVVRLDPATERAALLSLPRDLYLPISGTRGSARINSAIQGGPARLVATITDALDIPIHHYLEVDFQGFRDLVDAVDGVPVYFPDPVRDRRSQLNIPDAGCVTLDPVQALAYARSRAFEVRRDGHWEVDGSGDLGRISLNPLRHLDPFGSVLLPALMYILSAGRMIFGAAKPTPVDLRNTRNPRLANLVVSAAGPVSNLLLASIALLALIGIRAGAPNAMADLLSAIQGERFAAGALAPVTYVLFQFLLVNVVLAIFNLIPIPPLDGSGVVISLFGGSVARLYATIRPFGFIILILLLYSGFLSRVLRPVLLVVYALVFEGVA